MIAMLFVDELRVYDSRASPRRDQTGHVELGHRLLQRMPERVAEPGRRRPNALVGRG
jgi:hypothetical protein